MSARRAHWGIGRREAVAIAAVAVLASAVRLVRLGELPPGLHVDEAYNILDARAILAGWRPVFLPDNAGREALYSYWQAFLIGTIGDSVATARLSSAIPGIVTVVAVWAFVRRLAMPRPTRVAVLAAAYTAVSYWHLHFSRFGIRASVLPLLATGTMAVWLALVADDRPDDLAGSDAAGDRGRPPGAGGPRAAAGQPPPEPAPDARRDADIQSAPSPWRRPVRIGLLALLLAAALYSHPVGRVLWTVPAAHAAYLWLRRRDGGPARAFVAAACGTLLLALPLLLAWYQAPWLVAGHLRETSVIGAGAGHLAANAVRVLGMFNVSGDPAAWRNLPGRPVFDPVTGMLFLGGLAVTVAAARRGRDWATLSLLWLGLMLLPTVATDAAPNFSRAIGIVPVAFLMPALGLDALAGALERRGHRAMASVAIVACVVLTAAAAGRDYFLVWARDAATPLAFDDEKASLGMYASTRARQGARVYVSPAMAGHPTVRAIADGSTTGFDPNHGMVAPGDAGVVGEYVYLPGEAFERAVRAQARALGASGERIELGLPGVAPGVHHAAWSVRVPPDDSQPGSAAPPAAGPVFGDTVRLLGITDAGVRAGRTASITLTWQVIAAPGRDLITTVRLERPDGTVISQRDGPPVGGTYPGTAWRRGERIVDEVALAIPPGTTPGPAVLRVGWYGWPDMQPLPTATGAQLADVAAVQVTR